MRRSILLMLVYAGTISLWGILPVCLFVPGEIWLQPFVKGSFMLILAGFLIRKNLSGFTGKEPQGIGYYLYGAGYWGDGDPEDIYCGLNRRAFWYLVHWQLMMLLCLILGNWMREMPSSAADPLRFIFFHNLLTPLYGVPVSGSTRLGQILVNFLICVFLRCFATFSFNGSSLRLPSFSCLKSSESQRPSAPDETKKNASPNGKASEFKIFEPNTTDSAAYGEIQSLPHG